MLCLRMILQCPEWTAKPLISAGYNTHCRGEIRVKGKRDAIKVYLIGRALPSSGYEPDNAMWLGNRTVEKQLRLHTQFSAAGIESRRDITPRQRTDWHKNNNNKLTLETRTNNKSSSQRGAIAGETFEVNTWTVRLLAMNLSVQSVPKGWNRDPPGNGRCYSQAVWFSRYQSLYISHWAFSYCSRSNMGFLPYLTFVQWCDRSGSSSANWTEALCNSYYCSAALCVDAC